MPKKRRVILDKISENLAIASQNEASKNNEFFQEINKDFVSVKEKSEELYNKIDTLTEQEKAKGDDKKDDGAYAYESLTMQNFIRPGAMNLTLLRKIERYLKEHSGEDNEMTDAMKEVYKLMTQKQMDHQNMTINFGNKLSIADTEEALDLEDKKKEEERAKEIQRQKETEQIAIHTALENNRRYLEQKEEERKRREAEIDDMEKDAPTIDLDFGKKKKKDEDLDDYMANALGLNDSFAIKEGDPGYPTEKTRDLIEVEKQNAKADLEIADRAVSFFGSSQYSRIFRNYTILVEGEKRLAEADSEDEISPEKLKEEQARLYEEKKKLVVEMKHYVNRKNDEKNKAASKGKKENSNSQLRREAVENAIEALEDDIKLYETENSLEGKDKFFENIVNELEYGNVGVKGKALYNEILADAKKLDKLNKESNNKEELIDKEAELIGKMQRYMEGKHKSIRNNDGSYSFSRDGGKDGKPIEPKNNTEKRFKIMIDAYEQLSEHLLSDLAIYKPSGLKKAKELFGNVNQTLGTKVDITKEREPRTLDEVIMVEEKKLASNKEIILNEELAKKNSIEANNANLDASEQRKYVFYGMGKKIQDSRESMYKIMYANKLKEEGKTFDKKKFEKGLKEFKNDISNDSDFHAKLSLATVDQFNLQRYDYDTLAGTTLDSKHMNKIMKDAFKEAIQFALQAAEFTLRDRKPEEVRNKVERLDRLERTARENGFGSVYDEQTNYRGKNMSIKDAVKKYKAVAKQVLEPHRELKMNNPTMI